jgi:putative transposase
LLPDNDLRHFGVMRNIYRSLLLILAGATQRELARYVRYLKTENRILRSKLPTRVDVTPRERNRLIRFGAKLGRAMNELITIVHPDTLRRWIREDRKGYKRTDNRGRRRTAEDIRKLILLLAKDNGWGYTRILGELRKLHIRSVCRNTVKNILKANGTDTGPKRGLGTWDEFIKIHAATLWQCDFFTKRIVTPKGLRDAFVLVFLQVKTRRVVITLATQHPNEAWMTEQAAAFLKYVKTTKLGADIVMHDRDGKFTASFDQSLKAGGLRVHRTPYRSPNTVAFVERFIQTIKQECLHFFVVFGERNLNYLISEFVQHYHEERPHQGLDNERPVRKGYQRKTADEPSSVSPSAIGCKRRLGGLLKHYYRKAA